MIAAGEITAGERQGLAACANTIAVLGRMAFCVARFDEKIIARKR